MPFSIPAADMALQRSNPQYSRCYLVVQQPQWSTDSGATWTGYDWSARIDGDHTVDPMAALTIDNGGAAIDLLDGQTVLVGSSFGAWDKGVFRVRGDQTVGPATTTLNVGLSSDIRGHVLDDDYLVVLDEFRFWQRYGRIEIDGDDVVWYKDYDIEWSDLGANDPARRLAMMPPVPNMWEHAVKFVEIGGSSADIYFDWQYSYATAVGAAITDWVSEGESDNAGGTWNSVAETPGNQTFDAISGLKGFRVTLEVDDGNGNATTLPFRRGIRYVFTLRRPGETQVGDPDNAEPITDFRIDSPPSATFSEGFWRTSITVFADEAEKYQIMPEALVILFTEDTYTDANGNPVVGSVGPHTDRENILLIGRVVADSIRKDPETGDVSFEVASPGAEASLYHNYPVVIQNDDSGTTWIDTPDLTVDRAVHYYTTWHTNLNQIADYYQSNSTIEIYAMDFLEGTIYDILNSFLWDRLFARLLCDKYGRFFGEINAQDRAAGTVDTWWTMQQADWLDEVQVRENMQTPVNAIDCGGIIFTEGADPPVTPKLSRAPGTYDRYRGARTEANALAITSQNTLNTSCGRHLNGLNYEYEIDFHLAGNWRWCDIVPERTVDIGTLVTERGTLTGTYLIRGVTNTYDPDTGTIFTDIQTVQEMDDGVVGVTIPIPDQLPDPDYTPYWPEAFETLVPIGAVPQYPSYGPWLYCTMKTDADDYYTSDVTASPPVWTQVTPADPIDKTCMMYSTTANRFWGYGYNGIWEYQDLPLGSIGSDWAEVMSDDDVADECGHLADYWEAFIFRMQFSIRPGQEGWAWAGVQIYWDDGDGDTHYGIWVLYTTDAWSSVTYATNLFEFEDGTDWTYLDACEVEENGLALDMHSNTVYVACGMAPDQDGFGSATDDGWWRLYRSQNFGFSFDLAQEVTFTWGVDGYEHAGYDDGACDVWVPWVSDTYAGGAVFWTAAMLDTANDSSDIELDTLIYRSLNHGLAYDRIGDDGGLSQGLNYIGGPWNSLDRVYGGLSMTDGLDADQTKIWTWLDGAGWTLFRDTNTPTWRNCYMLLVTAQSGYTLSSCMSYEDPYYIQSGSDEAKQCTEEEVSWMTVVSV